MAELVDGTHVVPRESQGAPLDRVLRGLYPGVPWTKIGAPSRAAK